MRKYISLLALKKFKIYINKHKQIYKYIELSKIYPIPILFLLNCKRITSSLSLSLFIPYIFLSSHSPTLITKRIISNSYSQSKFTSDYFSDLWSPPVIEVKPFLLIFSLIYAVEMSLDFFLFPVLVSKSYSWCGWGKSCTCLSVCKLLCRWIFRLCDQSLEIVCSISCFGD